MKVTDPHTFYVVNLCYAWIQYSNYDICPSDSLQHIRQNHWTMKYRSLTYIYSFSSMSHWISITSTTLIHQIVFKIEDKITRPCYVGHWPTHILCGKYLTHMDPIFHYDICPSYSLQDIRQNHWTMKYRSLTYMYSFSSVFVSRWISISITTLIHWIVLKI